MCISFNKVSPVQLIYHESRYTEVKAIDVTHPIDMNCDPTYSAGLDITLLPAHITKQALDIIMLGTNLTSFTLVKKQTQHRTKFFPYLS